MLDGARRLGRDVATGCLAAVRAPRLIESGMPALLAWSDSGSIDRDPSVGADRPVRVAHGALRLLARIPGGHWRNTCLYRSVAECTIRRAHGASARVAIGVDKQDGGVVAHSWVEVAGSDARDARTMTPLHHAGFPTVAD